MFLKQQVSLFLNLTIPLLRQKYRRRVTLNDVLLLIALLGMLFVTEVWVLRVTIMLLVMIVALNCLLSLYQLETWYRMSMIRSDQKRTHTHAVK